MPKRKSILILTSKTGGGHLSLAEALRDLLASGVPATEGEHEQFVADEELPAITIVDPQPRFFHLHYRFVGRKALWLWAAEFRFFDTPRRAMLAHQIFTRLVRKQLIDLLDKVQPDIILTTYPFLSYEVKRILERRSPAVPLVMLFSDANSVHAAWLTERQADATFATTRETYKQALATGFDPQRLHLVGWPVRAQFFQAYSSGKDAQKEQLARLGLAHDRFTIFLQGGGEGTARAESAINTMLVKSDLGQDLQVILAAGTNAKLLARYKNTPNLVALPYTKGIAPFMAAADVIMGKAGPNALFESVTLNKPFIATSFIPGQEQENLSFIQRHGLGWVALRPQEQLSLLTTLIHNANEMKAMSSTIEEYRCWNAAANRRIIQLVHALLNPSLFPR
jgi:UDP-N-acetylglucosamine:LPS N-acetylglucosamine transferase